jgi:hypothetical protein
MLPEETRRARHLVRSRRCIRITLVLYLLTASVVAAACALVVPGLASSANRTALCDARDILVWLRSPGEPGAGSSWYTLALTNFSAHQCGLSGYPAVFAVDRFGRQLGSAAARTHRSPVRTVVVDPEHSAQFLLQVNGPGFFPRAACRPTMAAGLRIHLPNSTATSLVPVPLGACSRTGPTFLHTAAVTR